MIRTYKNFLIAIALFPLLTLAQSSGVEVMQIDSPAGNTLHSGEPLYVGLKYTSNQPLRFQLAGYRAGARVDKPAALNPAPAYPAGAGEALAWIAYSDKVDIDELRILAYDQDWKIVYDTPVPLEMHWSGRPSRNWRHPADWVQALNTQLQALTPAGSTEQPPVEQQPAEQQPAEQPPITQQPAQSQSAPLLWALPVLGVFGVILLIVWHVRKSK